MTNSPETPATTFCTVAPGIDDLDMIDLLNSVGLGSLATPH
jgi:hypothetical protein